MVIILGLLHIKPMFFLFHTTPYSPPLFSGFLSPFFHGLTAPLKHGIFLSCFFHNVYFIIV